MAGSLSGLRCRLMMAEFMFENRVCVTIQKKVGQDRPKFFAKLFLKTIWTWAPGCQVLSLSLLFKCRSKLLEVGCQVLFPFFANAAANFLRLGCLFFHISAVQKSSETLRHRDAKSFLWPSFAKCSNKLLCIYHCKSSREPL